MKINILCELQEGPFGGGNQFLKALKNEFERQDLYIDDPNNADVIIFNSYPFRDEYRFRQILNLKKKDKILLHRIDGPISVYREKDRFIDKILYYFNQSFVDGTIFQSLWSERSNHELGMKHNKYEKVIINAPDPKIFYHGNNQKKYEDGKIKIIITSWSANWWKGFDIYQYLDAELDFNKYDILFIGNSPITFKNFRTIEPLPSNELAEYLRNSDIFISASFMESCSNALLEAMHCGCVPVARNNSSHPEIVGDAGVIFYGIDDVLKKIDEAASKLDYFQPKINLPNIETIANKYIDFSKTIFSKKEQRTYDVKKGNIFNYYYIMLMVYFRKLKRL
ncbi:MAG: glycosyltransferase [bacterium]